jgi:membrane protease YdiL (CAAX protease family)
LTNGVPNDVIFWAAIIFAALLFGVGHLPATARLAPLTPLLVARGLLLNAILGVVAGVLFWRYGLEAAMIAHFSADIVLHVLPAPFLKRRQRTRIAQGF